LLLDIKLNLTKEKLDETVAGLEQSP